MKQSLIQYTENKYEKYGVAIGKFVDVSLILHVKLVLLSTNDIILLCNEFIVCHFYI